MRSTVDTERLKVAVKAKRGRMSLRDAAKDCGLDYQTLHRVEKGGKPDTDTFVTLCNWIGVSSDFFTTADKQTTPA